MIDGTAEAAQLMFPLRNLVGKRGGDFKEGEYDEDAESA
jgi:hypothetical protein